MKKYILISIFFILKPIIAEDLEITKWFNQESEQFLEIMNNPDKKDYNFEKYEKFVERNFALKSISYGLINEKIIEENSEETLLEYQDTFKKYLINTIYNLANTTTSGKIILRDIDLKDKIFIINSEIKDGRSSISLYWKVFKADDKYKIVDVIVENTSYFVTKKSEFTKILRKNRGNLKKLIEELNNF
ncbi:ABC transporter substrate-binding protein [Alphaproteobacteria bacterium]|nr:ABC transporter substrate-binding protein [Alphaproteobacteria bacterium]